MATRLDQIYDDLASTYDESRGIFDMSGILETFQERLQQHGRGEHGHLLDLGCGAGEPFARNFVDRGWDVTGVDFSREMLDLAARYVPEMTTIHQDMIHARFRRESFDAITAIYSLFHVPHEYHAGLFRRFERWLRPGGLALFTYATQAYTGRPTFDGHREFMGRRLYYSHKRPREMVGDLLAVNLSILAMEEHEIGGETFLWVTARKD